MKLIRAVLNSLENPLRPPRKRDEFISSLERFERERAEIAAVLGSTCTRPVIEPFPEDDIAPVLSLKDAAARKKTSEAEAANLNHEIN